MFAARRFNRSVIYMTQDCYELVASPCRDEALINTSVVKKCLRGCGCFFLLWWYIWLTMIVIIFIGGRIITLRSKLATLSKRGRQWLLLARVCLLLIWGRKQQMPRNLNKNQITTRLTPVFLFTLRLVGMFASPNNCIRFMSGTRAITAREIWRRAPTNYLFTVTLTDRVFHRRENCSGLFLFCFNSNGENKCLF